MNQEGTSTVKDILNGPVCNAVGLWHTRLRELMPSAEPQIPHRANDIVGIIGVYYRWSDNSEEMLQGFLNLDCTLGGHRVSSHVPRIYVLHHE